MKEGYDKPIGVPEPSYVMANRDYADIAHLENPGVIDRILSGTRSEGLVYVSALLQSGLSRYVVAGPKVAVTAMAIEALADLSRELSAWRNAGTIPEDFSGRPSGYQTWVDLLREIDSNPVDGERLKAMKAMFLAANRVNASDGESILAYQLFQIAKKLTSGQLLLLKAACKRAKRENFSPVAATRQWCEALARELGHNVAGLVGQDEKALVAAGLLTERTFPDASGVSDNGGRLTDLAEKFCVNIQTYHADRQNIGR